MPDSAEDNVACRICMDSKDNYVSLFTYDLSKKVMEVADVQVEKDDGLPEIICTECENDLEKCYEFRLKVQVADKKFRNNVKFSQVDIEECDIKEERYVDDGNSVNIEDRDSVSMDNDSLNDALPDIALKNREETEGAEPDPLSHVLVVEDKERKIEMSEDPFTQDEVMIEEPNAKKVEEPALDPLVCLKEEADTEIMDIDGSQTDPFGPSSSVRSTDLPITFPILSPTLSSEVVSIKNPFKITKDDQQPIVSSKITKARQDLTVGKAQRPLLPVLDPQGGSAQDHFIVGKNQHPNQGFMIIPQTGFNLNSGILIPCVKFTPKTYALPKNSANSQGNTTLFVSGNCVNFQNVTTSVTNIFDSSIQNSCVNSVNKMTDVADISHGKNQSVIMQPATTIESKINDFGDHPKTNSEKYENKQNSSVEVENINKTEMLPSALPDEVKPSCESEFFCSVCNVDCGNPYLLQEHKSEKEFICRACTTIFNNHQELEAHFFSHRRFTCDTCKKGFYVKKDLFYHKNTTVLCNKKPRKEICKLCNRRFLHKVNLQTHMEQKHKNGEYKAFTCLICKSSYKSNSIFRHHMRSSHTVYESVECDICHKIVSGPEKLKIHIKSTHLQPTEGCLICNKVFSDKHVLNIHMEKHNGKDIVCGTCGAVVKGEASFKIHLSRRHNKKIYSCKFCDATFDSRYKKEIHNRIHNKTLTKPTSAVCEICGKEYKNKETLKNHMVTHSDAKPYVCEICGAAFKTKVVLKTHSRIHDDPRKYSCEHCGACFRWKQTFDKHVVKCGLSRNDDMSGGESD